MKVSRFNIFFPYQENIAGYNSLENDFIFLTNELYELYIKALSEDVDQLKVIHPDFWELLADKNFVVSDSIDELQHVKDIIKSIDCNPEQYHLIINPTLNCNFKCWYCYETHIKNSKMSEDTIEKIKKHIAHKLNDGVVKQFTISWFGGEPLLYYKKVIAPILEFTNEYIADKDIRFNSNFTSNGLLINKKILKDSHILGFNSFQITLDGHRDKHNEIRFIGDKKGTYDILVSNIKKCLRSNIYINCRINISKDSFKDIEKIIDDFSDLSSIEKGYLMFSFNKVWQEKENLQDQILELIKLFNSHHFSTQYNMHINTVRSSCYADKENQATINYNGDVFKCTARDFTPERREGVLKDDGTIEWNEKYDTRMNVKFKNPPCMKCNILPICNGSCSQKALESNGVEYCIRGFDENKKIDFVRSKLESILN